jgi:hypothetical protein
MVCLRNIRINTLQKGAKNDNDDDDDNNNNNNDDDDNNNNNNNNSVNVASPDTVVSIVARLMAAESRSRWSIPNSKRFFCSPKRSD